MPKVKDYMCKNVFFVRPDFSIFDVAKIFWENRIAGAPVVEKGKIIGVVSVSDIVRFMTIKLADFEDMDSTPSMSMLLINAAKMGDSYLKFKKSLDNITKTKIKHVMSKNVISIEPEANLFEAAELMDKHDINRLPVVEKGKLVGIICREDLMRSLI